MSRPENLVSRAGGDQSPSENDKNPTISIYRDLFRKLFNNVQDGDNEMWQPFNKDKFTIEHLEGSSAFRLDTGQCRVHDTRSETGYIIGTDW